MSGTIGRVATLAISDDDVEANYVDIGKVTSNSFDFANDLADCTNNDSGGFKEAIYADSQATVDLEANYDESNTAQSDLVDAEFSKLKKWVRFRHNTGPGLKEFRFQANFADLTIDTSTGDVETLSVSIESTGVVIKAAQT